MFAGVGTSTQGSQAGRAHTQPGLTIGRGTHSSSVPTTWFRTSPPDVFAGVGTSAHGLHRAVSGSAANPLIGQNKRWKSEQEASLGTGVWRINDCKES
uniref:Uncharacterized protein n=1 Tax=Oryza nivara TaxID=4536 RepID=A0A0E0GSA9_ORYNI